MAAVNKHGYLYKNSYDYHLQVEYILLYRLKFSWFPLLESMVLFCFIYLINNLFIKKLFKEDGTTDWEAPLLLQIVFYILFI